jgi:hypothetical protein
MIITLPYREAADLISTQDNTQQRFSQLFKNFSKKQQKEILESLKKEAIRNYLIRDPENSRMTAKEWMTKHWKLVNPKAEGTPKSLEEAMDAWTQNHNIDPDFYYKNPYTGEDREVVNYRPEGFDSIDNANDPFGISKTIVTRLHVADENFNLKATDKPLVEWRVGCIVLDAAYSATLLENYSFDKAPRGYSVDKHGMPTSATSKDKIDEEKSDRPPEYTVDISFQYRFYEPSTCSMEFHNVITFSELLFLSPPIDPALEG